MVLTFQFKQQKTATNFFLVRQNSSVQAWPSNNFSRVDDSKISRPNQPWGCKIADYYLKNETVFLSIPISFHFLAIMLDKFSWLSHTHTHHIAFAALLYSITWGIETDKEEKWICRGHLTSANSPWSIRAVLPHPYLKRTWPVFIRKLALVEWQID